MARVFISHASADLAVAVDIRLWLHDAGHEAFLDRDLREGIQVGEEWKRRLYRELRKADAIVCVVTDDYRTSEWCSAEVGMADMLGCRVLPVRAAAAAESALLDGLQYADLVTDPGRARAELLGRLEQLGAASGLAWAEGRSPYPGLRSFEADMARVFRGRSVEVRQLVGRLRSLGERAGGGLLVVVGPSGCGKSSLVKAGLVPAVAVETGWEVSAPFTPGTDPVVALARALTATANRAGLAWSLATTTATLAEPQGLTQLAGELLLHGRRAPRERLLVAIDQGEELLTQSSPERLASFFQVLSGGLAGPVRAVITLRSEFLDRLRAVPELSAVDLEPFALRPLDVGLLRTIIEEPAAVAGFHIDAELVDRLVTDAAGGEALPLLAFSLAELARGKSRGDELSAQDYADLGGVQGALASHADAALDAACQANDLRPQAVLDGLTRLATLDATGQPTRRRLPASGLELALQAAFEAFVDHRLLVTATETDGVSIGVAHEALLTAWPPLAAAVEARRSTLRELRIIETAAAQWHGAQEAPAYLWDDDRLTAAQLSLGSPGPPGSLDSLPDHPDLDPRARDFLVVSTTQARETKIRMRRRKLTTVCTLSILLVLSILLGGLAGVTGAQAQKRADEVNRMLIAQDLVARADNLRGSERPGSLKLGLAAYAVSPHTEAAEASLLETLDTPRPIGNPLGGLQGGVNALAFSPDGHTLVTGADDHAVRLWNVDDLAHPQRLTDSLGEHDHNVTAVAFSPGSPTLASGAEDGTVVLWNSADRTRPSRLGRPFDARTGEIGSLALSADGALLAVAGTAGLRIWDITHPERPRPWTDGLADQAEPAQSVAFSADGRVLALAGGDRAVLWDVANPRPIGTIDAATGLTSVALSLDGHLLATGDGQGLELWDVTDPGAPRQLAASIAGEFVTLEFSANGRTLLAGSAATTPLLVDLTDAAHPRPLGDAITSGIGDVRSMALSPDGRTVAIGTENQMVQFWAVPDPTRVGWAGSIDTGGVDPSRSVAFVDGNTLLVKDLDGARVWDVHDRARPEVLAPLITGHSSQPIGRVTFSPTADVAVVSTQPEEDDAETTAQVWDLAEPSRPEPVGPPIPGDADRLVLSPDGRTLVVGSASTIKLWDVTDPDRAQPLVTLPTDRTLARTTTVAFSPDGHTLAVGSGVLEDSARVSLWSVTAGESPRKLGDLPPAVDDEQIDAMAFSPDSHTLAVASSREERDGGVSLWDVTTPHLPRQIGRPLDWRAGERVTALTFSPDGRTLVAGASAAPGEIDGSARMWDVTDLAGPRRLGTHLTGNAGEVTSVAFAPDGHTLAVGSSGRRATDDVVRLWDVSRLLELRQDVVDVACEEAGGLSRAEWEQLVPDLPFADPCGSS
jgi:WD40 repeat protein